jgi:hypothetical protein
MVKCRYLIRMVIKMTYLPFILLGTIIFLSVGIDVVAKKRKSKATPDELNKSGIQKDWYKPHSPGY